MTIAQDFAIAVVDDDDAARDTLVDLLQATGATAFGIESPPSTIPELLKSAKAMGAKGLICDHFLTQRWKVAYTGAETVAAGFSEGLPSILITQYIGTTLEKEIRKRREKIPVVLPRDRAMEDEDSIAEAFALVTEELSGRVPAHRRSIESIFTIEALVPSGTQQLVEVSIHNWRSNKIVELDDAIFPSAVKPLTAGKSYRALVNIGADDPRDLFFKNIRSAADPVAAD